MRRLVRWLAGLLALGLVADALRARERLGRLAVARGGGPDAPPPPDPSGFAAIVAEGVALPPVAFERAVAHAEAEGLDVVDLVPPELPVEEALELAAQVDPEALRTDRLALGRGAFRAMVVRRSVLDRSEVPPTAVGPGAPAGDADPVLALDPVAFVAAHTELKRLAPVTTGVAVVEGFDPPPFDVDRRLAHARALFGTATPAVLAVPVVQWSIIGAGLALAPPWGAAALAAYCGQPLVALGGDTPLRPPGVARHAALRWWREPKRWARTVRGRWAPAPEPDPVESRRPVYDELLADGVDGLLEPRREDCPVCGSHALAVALETGDVFQFKPGRFTLEECGSCGHVFQNPRLSVEGLDLYYRDFYDGLGEEPTELIFGATPRSYLDRAKMLRRHAVPERWLDVGGGHGHFCLVARDVWPDTTFDGLDMSDSIDEAARRGWVATGYRGMFPEVAPAVAGTYDVVSMHHYLEHTREPMEELDAARTALRPGGHLLIELPDPESPFGRWLGRWWIPWFQPQHQNLFSVGNLTTALEERGFTVVETHRSEAHQTVDFAIAGWLRLNDVGRPEMPWLPRRTPAQAWRRRIVLAVGVPFLAFAALADQVAALVVRSTGRGSNTYRVLARLDGS